MMLGTYGTSRRVVRKDGGHPTIDAIQPTRQHRHAGHPSTPHPPASCAEPGPAPEAAAAKIATDNADDDGDDDTDDTDDDDDDGDEDDDAHDDDDADDNDGVRTTRADVTAHCLCILQCMSPIRMHTISSETLTHVSPPKGHGSIRTNRQRSEAPRQTM